MGTHKLEAAGGTCQDTEIMRPRDRHLLPGDGRGNLSGHRKKATKREALTNWRQQREELVRTPKKPTEQGALTD